MFPPLCSSPPNVEPFRLRKGRKRLKKSFWNTVSSSSASASAQSESCSLRSERGYEGAPLEEEVDEGVAAPWVSRTPPRTPRGLPTLALRALRALLGLALWLFRAPLALLCGVLEAARGGVL